MVCIYLRFVVSSIFPLVPFDSQSLHEISISELVMGDDCTTPKTIGKPNPGSLHALTSARETIHSKLCKGHMKNLLFPSKHQKQFIFDTPVHLFLLPASDIEKRTLEKSGIVLCI